MFGGLVLRFKECISKASKFAAVLIVLVALLSCCCVSKESPEGMELVDMAGNKVVLSETPKRAVFLAGESWIYALGVKDRVIGVSRWAYGNPVILKIDPNIKDIPSPGDMTSVNVEELIKLNPDVVIVWDEPPAYAKTSERIEKLGVPVIRIGHIEKYPDDLCKQAELLGKVFGVEDRAEKVCAYLSKKYEEIKAKAPENRVKVIYSFMSPYQIAAKNNSYSEFIRAVGGENVGDIFDGIWITVNKEWIIQQNPEVWIISYYAKYDESAILNDPALKDITAVKNKAVHKESYKPLQFLEPYFILTVMEYASWINPEVYNFNLTEEEEEFLSEVYGVG